MVRMEKRALQQQVEELKPKKRFKVVPDQNRRFVQIEQVQVARGTVYFQETHKPRSGAVPVLGIADTCLDL